MEKPVITKECVKPLLETKFVKVYDLQYAEGRHYYDATRRDGSNLVACKSDEEFKAMQADAVNCFVIVKTPGMEPRLLSFYEFRYPTGRFLLSPPAGLVDPEDKDKEDSLIITAKREIEEETGLKAGDEDEVFIVNPLVFSTPGLTDESNALVCAVINLKDEKLLNNRGNVGGECISDFKLMTKEEVLEILKSGRDEYGNYYSMYTWAAMMFFASDMWKGWNKI